MITPLQMAAFYRAIACRRRVEAPVVLGSPRTRELFGEYRNVLCSALLLATREGTGQAAYLDGLGSAGRPGPPKPSYGK